VAMALLYSILDVQLRLLGSPGSPCRSNCIRHDRNV
jgi:hypothetical protein